MSNLGFHFSLPNLGVMILRAGALVCWAKEERSSQWRFKPCIISSAWTMRSEIWDKMRPLACTWAFRLLVRLARLPRLTSRLLEISVTLVFADPRVPASCALMLVGNSHSPREPFGPLRFSVIFAKLVTMGLALTS